MGLYGNLLVLCVLLSTLPLIFAACSDHTDCDSCTDDGDCVWCESDPECLDGGFWGADGLFQCKNYYWRQCWCTLREPEREEREREGDAREREREK